MKIGCDIILRNVLHENCSPTANEPRENASRCPSHLDSNMEKELLTGRHTQEHISTMHKLTCATSQGKASGVCFSSTCCTVEDGLELLIILSSPPQCCNYRCMSPLSLYSAGDRSQGFMLGRQSLYQQLHRQDCLSTIQSSSTLADSLRQVCAKDPEAFPRHTYDTNGES